MAYLHMCTSMHACRWVDFGEWHFLCNLGGERIHADDALEPPRVGVEQRREGLEDSNLRGAYQRRFWLVEIFTPSARWLQQSEQRNRTSSFHGQIKGQLFTLPREQREAM